MLTRVGRLVTRRSFAAIVLLLTACRDHRIIQPTLALPRPGDPVPAFTVTLRDSSRLASADLRGKPSVLFLWSTHCPTSRRALADYRTLRRDYAERADIILFSDDATATELALLPRILADSGIDGRVALVRGGLTRLFDRSRTAPERDTARISFVLPAYLVLDRDGRVVARAWGPNAVEVRAVLDSLFASRPAA